MRSKALVLVLVVLVTMFSCVTKAADVSGAQVFEAVLQNITSGGATSSNMALINQDLQAAGLGASQTFMGSQNADTTNNGSASQYLSGAGAQGGTITGGCWTSSLSGSQLLCLDGIQQNTGGVVAQGGLAGQTLIVAGPGKMIGASQMAGFAQFSNVSGGWCSSGSSTQAVDIVLTQGAVVN